jgi:hypothetical protein
MTDIEASCLMKVLAKPELDSAVILNEFVLIMENFGIPVTSDEAHELAKRYDELFAPGPIAEIDFGVRQPDRPSNEFSFSTVRSRNFPSHVTRSVFDHIHHFVRSRGIKNIMYYTPDKKKHRIYQAGAKKLGITAVNMSYLGPLGPKDWPS